MMTHSSSFLKRNVIYFRKVQFDIFVAQKVIYKIDGFSLDKQPISLIKEEHSVF